MKKYLFLFAALLTGSILVAQPPAGPANPGDFYGEKITRDGAVDLKKLPELLEKNNDSMHVKVLAVVTDVCPKKGCWLRLQMPDDTKVFVKMKNYGFFLPLDVKGKTIVLDGEAKIKTTSVAELRHYAEDAKKSKEEIEAITEPEQEIRLTARGILVVG